MRLLGITLLALGMAFAIYAMNMDVSVKMQSQYFGYGIQTPEMKVANLDLISQRQNTIVIGGILAVVGAIFTGIGTLAQSKLAPSGSEEIRSESKVENAREDRVEFRSGMYYVGQRCFDTFADAESFFDESERKKKPQA